MSSGHPIDDRPNLRFQRLAAQVADHLRARILRGDLEDLSLLPKEEELRTEYPVSKPSLREAMRILEAEGLITIRRGNMGGAVVHRPTSANVAYTLGLVLGSRAVPLHDVAQALREVEPACAALCATRKGRMKAVVAPLKKLHAEAVSSVDDLVEVVHASRRFHEALVQLCGNETLIIMAGALEVLWSSHEADWVHASAEPTDIPVEERLAVLEQHAEILRAIEAGDADGARDAAARHLTTSQDYPGRGGVVDPVAVRNRDL